MKFTPSACKRLSLIVVIIMSGVVTACYRMPTDDDYCVLPMTNSPDLQRKDSKSMPSVGY